MNMNDPFKILEYEQYREALNSCGHMTYYQLKELLEVRDNKHSFGNLLSMVIRKSPVDLIGLYDKYKKNNKKG